MCIKSHEFHHVHEFLRVLAMHEVSRLHANRSIPHAFVLNG